MLIFHLIKKTNNKVYLKPKWHRFWITIIFQVHFIGHTKKEREWPKIYDDSII